MGGGRKTETIIVSESSSSMLANSSFNSQGIARNLHKADLGGVIFGCKHSTISECLAKQIFGLPGPHISYIRNIEPGLPLFLFNYSDRMLHGIYESASPGKLNIDPYAWTEDGKEKTAFPAQVRIRMKTYCQPIPEKNFRLKIENNYYTTTHFYFELDYKQTKGLTSLFTPSPQIGNIGHQPGNNQLRILPTNKNASGYVTRTINSNEHAKATFKQKKPPNSWADLVAGNPYASLPSDEGDNDLSGNESSSIADDGETKETVSDWEELCSDNRQPLPSDHVHGLEESQNLEQEELWSDNGQPPPSDPEHPSGERQNLGQEFNDNDLNVDRERILEKLKKMVDCAPADPTGKICEDESAVSSAVSKICEVNISEQVREQLEKNASTSVSVVENAELVQFVKELRARSIMLEKKLIETERELDQLRKAMQDSDKRYQQLQERVKELEAKHGPSMALVDESLNESMVEQLLGSEKSIYLIGGFNGESWLDSLDSYSPSLDILTHLKPMSCPRSYAAAASLNGCFYVFGGGCGDNNLWYDTVECYNPRNDEWTLCPSLAQANGSLAGATLKGKIFAVGGGDGHECFSHVEMFDPVLGRWIGSRSMLEKRFALAASELNGVLYAAGGFDGVGYLSSAERFDPREGFWSRIPSMKTRRGCHSSVILNEKLYVVGGYNGEQMVSSTEVFDPRAASWLTVDPMNSIRGYAGAAVLGGSLYVIGGVKDLGSTIDAVEVYREGAGWMFTSLKATGTRSFFSTVVLE